MSFAKGVIAVMGFPFRDPDEEGIDRYISDATADGAPWDDGYPPIAIDPDADDSTSNQRPQG